MHHSVIQCSFLTCISSEVCTVRVRNAHLFEYVIFVTMNMQPYLVQPFASVGGYSNVLLPCHFTDMLEKKPSKARPTKPIEIDAWQLQYRTKKYKKITYVVWFLLDTIKSSWYEHGSMIKNG